MPIVDELIAILGYRIEGKGKLNEFTRGIDGVEKKARKSAGVIGGVGRTLVSTFAGAATIGAVSSATKRFAEFERTLTRIGITAGASAGATAKAGEVLYNLAQNVALPMDEAVKGLDTLTSSGKSLEEAMAFLPSVLATAQASGAATEDIANTALKSADALKIETKHLQKAFDIMVTGGKAGQFELKDMAQYIPEIANGFAVLGYKGTDGLKKLIAIMQTLREKTGNASTAADQARNLFTKIYSQETKEKFSKFGINLTAHLDKARKAGKDILQTFVDLTKQAIKGDLSKLPLLFTDEQFLGAMRTLVTSEESLKRFLAALNGAEVDGAAFRDLNTVLGTTQTKIDQLGNSWDRFIKALGGTASGPVGSIMDAASDQLSFMEAVHEGLKKEGITDRFERNKRVIELTINPDERDRLARAGGYVPQAGLHPLGDSRLSPLQVERKKLEAEREALEAKRASVESMRVLRGTPGAEHKDRELTRFGADISDVNAKINRTYPVDPDRNKRFIGNEVAPPMPPSRPSAGADYSNQLQAVAAKVDGMNAHLSKMTGTAPVNATITDARQDNRQFPVTNNITVNQTVQEATQAPGAAANATAAAIKAGAEMQPARMQSGPNF